MTDTIDITAVSKLKHSDLWDAVKKYGSQKSLADFLGVSQTTVADWLNLKSVPGLRLIANNGEELDAKLVIATGKGLNEIFPEALRQAKEFLAAPKQIEHRASLSRQALEYYGQKTANRLEYKFPDVELNDDIQSAMKTLSSRERQMLTARFGLDGSGERTYDDLAREFRCTRERCRQITERAIRRMQDPSRAQKLVGHLP